MADHIKVLLIENQALTRVGIKAVLAETGDIDLAGESGDPVEGFRSFSEIKPDVTILGLRFPDSCTIDDLDIYFAPSPNERIIVLPENAGDAELTRA